ncbi:MAG TPA: hypothetical protein VHC22_14645 [Pirellulales bacterium]|nr:hypothetical protein [Pirellulales bacterium]
MPTDAELAEARAAALDACAKLEGRLADLPDGQSVGDELGLPGLREEIERETADVAALNRALAKLRRNKPDARGREYDRLQATAAHYLGFVRARATPDLAEQFATHLEQLESACVRYAADRSAENLALVIEPFVWLRDHGQVAELLELVREETVHANHRMRFSAAFLNRLVAQPITRPLSSNEMTDGARVNMRGTLNGKLSSVLVPDETQGVLRIGFNGMGNSGITAVKGRATVRARAQTDIHASEPVYLTTSGFRSGAPQSRVQHRTTSSNVSVRMRGRLLRRLATHIAAKVVGKQQAESDRKVSERTRRQVEDKLRTESARIVKEGNATLDSFGLFAALGENPEKRLRLRTTTNYLEWLGRYAGDRQFASPAGPPDFATAGNHAVLFQVHESAVNNGEHYVSGQTINEADFRELIFSTFGLVPAGDRDVVARVPATITFAEDHPLDVRIRDGQVFLEVRLDSITDDREKSQHGPYTVSTSYAPQTEGGVVKLVRTSPITIEPSTSTETEKLQEVLSRFFVPEAASSGKQPLAAFLAPAKLQLRQLDLVDGWLTLVLNLEEGAKRD